MRIFHLILAALLAFIPAAQAQETASPSFSALFAERNARTLAVLAAEFPSDHKALMIRIGAIERGGQSQPLMLAGGFDAIGAIRRKYAKRLSFAPPEALKNLLVSTALFHDAVLAGEGPGACGAFAQNGSGVLFQLVKTERYLKELDVQSALFFEAVASAIEQPEYYGDPRPEDFAALLAVMGEAGVPKTYATSIAAGKPSDPDLCPALSTMFKAAAVFDTPEGLRVRADLAQNLAGY